jgi:hypothetical protein
MRKTRRPSLGFVCSFVTYLKKLPQVSRALGKGQSLPAVDQGFDTLEIGQIAEVDVVTWGGIAKTMDTIQSHRDCARIAPPQLPKLSLLPDKLARERGEVESWAGGAGLL